MRGVQITLETGSLQAGSVTMKSPNSQFRVVRAARSRLDDYSVDLDFPGVYMLLIDSDTVYVGQTAMDTIGKRITNTHTGSIDAQWHTVLAFCCMDSTISSNELLYLENAMTEYAHKTYTKCVTTSPTIANCNEKYRKSHYKLTANQIHTCNDYLADIKDYIELFGETIFDQSVAPTPPPVTPPPHDDSDPSHDDDPAHDDNPVTPPPVDETEIFHFTSPVRDSYGRARIGIHLGHRKKRPTLLLAGARVSKEISENFASSKSVRAQREQLEAEGKLVNRILQVDVEFPSQSGAGQFLNGTSFDGNSLWRTDDGDMLKDLME